MDKGNFGYCQQCCSCGGDLKGMSCHGNCTRPRGAFRALKSMLAQVLSYQHLGEVNQSHPGCVCQHHWCCRGGGVKKKNSPKMKESLLFSSFLSKLGDCLQGLCEICSKYKEHTQTPTPFQGSSNILNKSAQVSWRAPGLEVFPAQTTPCQFWVPQMNRVKAWCLKHSRVHKEDRERGELSPSLGFNSPISEPWAAALLLKNCGLAANNPFPSQLCPWNTLHCRFMSTSLKNNSALAFLVPFQRNPEPGNVAFQPELL